MALRAHCSAVIPQGAQSCSHRGNRTMNSVASLPGGSALTIATTSNLAWAGLSSQTRSWCALRVKCCGARSEEHTSELQSLMRISYAVFCLKKKNKLTTTHKEHDD